MGQIQGDPGAYVRRQRPKTVQNIGKIASEKMVDAVLVAGDIFESNAVSDQTLYKFLDAVRTFTGPWIFLPGNHDPAVPGSVWARLEGMNCPSNLLFPRTAEPIMIANERLAILPVPLRRRHEGSDLTEDWSKVTTPPENAFRGYHREDQIGLADALSWHYGLNSYNIITKDNVQLLRRYKYECDPPARGLWGQRRFFGIYRSIPAGYPNV